MTPLEMCIRDRDYIYIPLGGSRCNVVRHMLNTLIVFAVSGLWHGADLRLSLIHI